MFLKGLSLLAVAGGAQFAIAFRVVTAEEAWSAINPGWNVSAYVQLVTSVILIIPTAWKYSRCYPR